MVKNPLFFLGSLLFLRPCIVLGLIGHLKTHFPTIYKLYLILKSRGTAPTEDELKIARGEKLLDPGAAAEYIRQLEQASVNIVDAFNKQVNKASVSIKLGVALVLLLISLYLGRLEPREIRRTISTMACCL
jgi:hypothetical protein